MIELRQLSKSFGTCQAAAAIDLRVERGTIHGIIGENGAGKTTAMNMLFGLFAPDSGEILIDGKLVRFASPQRAMACGIGMVHQHFMLSDAHSALDNIILGSEPDHPASKLLPRLLRPIDRGQARERIKALAQEFEFRVNLDSRIADLPVGLQQQVEILKLLYRGANILIFDEPTAVLTPAESRGLLRNLARLKAEGKTILIITHKLKEVMALTDRVTIFRHGRSVGERKTADTSIDELASLMVGRTMRYELPRRPTKVRGEEVCALHQVNQGKIQGSHSEAARLKGVSISLAAGEIVGIAGVEGNGQTEVIHAIRAPRQARLDGGRVSFRGEDATKDDGGAMRRRGLAIIPENRHEQALLLDSSLSENLLLGRHVGKEFRRGPLVSFVKLRQAVEQAIRAYDIRPADASAAARRFSGGNQQKIVVARECDGQPQVLIAAQPTRGVDIGAMQCIHDRILSLRDQGLAVLLISSDLDEIMTLSDRILVMYEGRIVAEVDGNQASEDQLGRLMGGAQA